VTELIFSHFLGTITGFNILHLHSSCVKHLSFLSYNVLSCSIIQPTPVQTPAINKPFCPSFHIDVLLACIEIHWCWTGRAGHGAGRGYFGILWGCQRLWGRGESLLSCHRLGGILCPVLANVSIPFLAYRKACRKLCGYIVILKGIVHFFQHCHAEGVLVSQRFPVKVSNDNLTLSIVQHKLVVLCYFCGFSIPLLPPGQSPQMLVAGVL